MLNTITTFMNEKVDNNQKRKKKGNPGENDTYIYDTRNSVAFKYLR